MLRESTGGVNTLYLHGLDIIGQQQGGTWTGFGYDPLGSVRFVLNSSGDLTHALNYDPYGVPYQSNSATSLGFTGEQTDPNDLVYLRARYYNPRLGTFTSVDPVLGVGGSTGWNGYVYANGNPANLTDPAGTCVDPLSFIVCAAAVVIGGIYINEWRGNVYANQMQGMSFWEAASYDRNRPCPTCEIALSFLVPPLGKAFATRDFAYTIATGTPAGKLEAIQQLLLMTAVESRLRQPALTPGSGGGWTLTPPGGAVTAEFSLPRWDWGRVSFAGGGSTLQPRLAWGVAAVPIGTGGALAGINTWGSNWILANSDEESTPRVGQVPYDDNFDLAKKVRDARREYKIEDGNFAVFEYEKPDGTLDWKINRNLPGEAHAERRIADMLNREGITPDKVRRIYTELQPCTMRTLAGNCRRFLAQNYPNTPVYYSFEYERLGDRGGWALQTAIQELLYGR